MADTREEKKGRDGEFSVTAASSRILCEAAGFRVSEEICKTWTLQQWLQHNLLNPITEETETQTHTQMKGANLSLCVRYANNRTTSTTSAA